MKICFRIFLFCLMTTSFLLPAQAQKRITSHENYIKKYRDLAVDHMKKYKIPASITLAQGLLESGAGLSSLSTQSNNHFGIKCHQEWTGQRVYHADDKPNDCFRKYKRVEDSFEDHSKFLSEKSRYASLFVLNVSDYKSWAKGLQQCGYATDKAYANKLIKLIEDYELYAYDTQKRKQTKKDYVSRARKYREVYKTSGLIYVVAKANDTFKDIAYDLDFKIKDLIKYNEVPEDFPLEERDIVYLEKKKKKADKPYYEHVVQIGESMHSISQKYGIRLKNFYKMNKLNGDEYVPEEGDVLRLR